MKFPRSNWKEIYTNQIRKKLIFSTTLKKNQQPTLENDTPPDIPHLDCQLDEITLTALEVKDVIKNLDINKAAGPDPVHNRLLIVAADVISEPQTHLWVRMGKPGLLVTFETKIRVLQNWNMKTAQFFFKHTNNCVILTIFFFRLTNSI